MPFSVEGQVAQAPSERPVAHFQIISPSYFRVMGIPLLKGRSFTEADAYSAPRVAIVNQTIVQRFFPNQDPIGKRLVIESLLAGRRELGPSVSWEIVGVIRNVKDFGLGEEAGPEIYVSYQQSPWPAAFLVVRTVTDPLRMVNSVKEVIGQIDKDQAVTDIRTMEQVIEESVSQPRFRTMLLATFAAIALALAGGGIYGGHVVCGYAAHP